MTNNFYLLRNQKKFCSNEENLDTSNTKSDLLLLSKQEKVLSKVLLRNIRYYDKHDFNNQDKNILYHDISKKLISNFNFSDENEFLNDHYLIDDNNVESNIIYSTQKSFYVDWLNSNLSKGKFVIKIKSQSKNIIFEDLFNTLNNLKDENSLFVINFDNNANNDETGVNKNEEENELISDSEDIITSSKNILDYPKEFLEDNKDRRKFDFVYNFDKNKPNQLIFFCEKLFVNDIINAEELSEIKRLAFVSGRNLKYTQDQNIAGNQYDSFQDALADIRILEKLDRMPEYQDVKLVFDLNLNCKRPDHKIEAKIKMPHGGSNQFIYVIADREKIDSFAQVEGISKIDDGEFFTEFVEKFNKNNYNKKYKLLIEKNNLEAISQKAEIYDQFIEKAIGFKNHIKNNKEEIISEIEDSLENKIHLALTKNNNIEVNIGDLNLCNEGLNENFSFMKKQILKLKPKTVKKNYIKNISVFVNGIELRLKNKE